MKEYLHDILRCLRIFIYIFIPTFIVGSIIGWFAAGHNYITVLIWGCRMNEWISCAGLGMAGVGFWKREKDDDETDKRERQWKEYFYRLKFPMVLFIISFAMLFGAFFVESLI